MPEKYKVELLPYPWGVIDYCREEVSRQGHDVSALDGIARVGWMLDAWSVATQKWADNELPDLYSIEYLGELVERSLNQGGFRQVNVRIGSKIFPRPEEVEHRLGKLLAFRNISPLEFYIEFEEIHPFADGNGRVGKILLNWLNNSMLAPQFPPNNIWGSEVRNP